MAAIDLLAKRARLVGAGLAGDVPSPCISICKLDSATEFCEGCFRTLDEIAAWGRMDDESKRAVWQLIAERLGQKTA
ncbi:DUF1289 domain-containing protein [Caenimonas soli]|jgi:predicted Fe-S protein YdhL (DUF1289 family)|uniref:DUF1289 domain-containing protein n=1 Tax=Caenimonas soli TaxID=2735555 RepID=UPI0015545D2D|nr:DUF1289 domain-containing protein [Caenimonas soli]NPC58616.1 DUF1289 domain-containing protein [Caenimonas soli]